MAAKVSSRQLIGRIPRELKRRIRTFPLVYRLRNALRRWRYADVAHDDIYDGAYFAEVENATSRGAGLMADCIVRRFHPKSALDVGCGTGALLDALRQRGISTLGVDCSQHALEYCRRRGIPCQHLNLAELAAEHPFQDRFDIAINMEVAHQLPEKAAVRLVKLLVTAAPAVIFSAETPGTNDRLPLNEQRPEYWIDIFKSFGYAWDHHTTSNWQGLWRAGQIAEYFCKNVLVFVASNRLNSP